MARMGSNRNSHSLLVGNQNGTATSEDSLAVSYKTKHTLNHIIQQSCFLAFTQMSWKLTYVSPRTCPQMFIAALFIIAKTWKQQKCPIGEWINKLWYTQTVEHHLALKRNEIPSHEKTWRKRKCILLNEKSIRKGNIVYDFTYLTF